MDNKSKENDLQNQKEECEKIAQDTFNRILAAYRLVIDEISDDSFEEVNKIIGEEMNKSLDRAGSAFKEHLYASIKDKFTKIWSDRQMDLNVAMLEVAKRNFVTQEKWRPTNKDAEEQLRPHLGKILLKQRDFLRAQIEEQNSEIAKLIPQIEHARNMMKSRIQKRSQVMAQIQIDKQRMVEATAQIDEILQKLSSSND